LPACSGTEMAPDAYQLVDELLVELVELWIWV
jgi:hypothetical protein